MEYMKRVLGIMASPRKNGNTHLLVSKILEGASAEGAITEILFLNDLTIRECDGCHV
jgi:multimeric flavodoxin WrbA